MKSSLMYYDWPELKTTKVMKIPDRYKILRPIPIAALLMFQISLVESSTRVSRQWTNANDSCVMSVMWHGYQYTFICLSGFI